jgi:hypothetical protein
LQQDLTIAHDMLPRITAESGRGLLDRPELCLAQSGSLKVCYAPFDHVALGAKLVVVGITPGMTQAVNALDAAHKAQAQGLSLEAVLAQAKLTASFSGGAIRSNLVAMLDGIGVARHFDVTSTADLFRPGSTAVHFTSALRYPVFVNGTNYNGTPDMLATPILRKMVETHLAEEADLLPEAIWLPLGPKAEAAILHLVRQGRLNGRCVLSGMPHPSGANTERVAVFLGRKDPAAASRQTNAAPLLAAFARLTAQMASIDGEAA